MEESPGVRLYQMTQVVDEIQEVPAGEKFHDQVKTGRRLEDGEKFDLSEGEDVKKHIHVYCIYTVRCLLEGGGGNFYIYTYTIDMILFLFISQQLFKLF